MKVKKNKKYILKQIINVNQNKIKKVNDKKRLIEKHLSFLRK